MSRRVEFEEAPVLSAALAVFHEQGYAATSLTDLERATGLNRSSLYNSYGSKEGFFQACLRHNADHGTRAALDVLNGEDFGAALLRLFELSVAADDPGFPLGCAATAGALELGGSGLPVAAEIEDGLRRMLRRLEARVARALAEGQVSELVDSEDLAALILAVMRGLVVLNKGTGKPDAAVRAYRQLLVLIEGRQ